MNGYGTEALMRMTVEVVVTDLEDLSNPAKLEVLQFVDVGRVYETTQGTLVLDDVYGFPRAGYARGTWDRFNVTTLTPLRPDDADDDKPTFVGPLENK